MSLCPSSSHQLVAAAIAFRRARRKFPKDFGLEIGHISAKAEAATNREGPINQAKSSSTLAKRACNSRSDHVCPASARNRDYEYPYGKENPIICSCCRTRNAGEDISRLRDECNGGDAIDTVPSRECEMFAASGADRENEFIKRAERDRCDVKSRNIDSENIKTTKWLSQFAPSMFHRHRKARCSSKPCTDLDPVNLLCDSPAVERNDKVACGDFFEDRSKEFASTSCHETSIDLDGNAEVGVVTGDARDHGPCIEDARMMIHRRIVDSVCRCERHTRQESIPDLLRSSCDRSCDGRCHHHRDHRYDCPHRHCCCHRRVTLSMNATQECKTHGSGIPGGEAQHKSWRDQMRGENSRLYARQCYSKEYSGIISAPGERNDEERGKNDENENEDDDDDDGDGNDGGGVGVINHKDSMCILAEKYKAGRKCRARRCGDKARSGDRTGRTDECNKSLTLEIIDQPESSRESANVVPHERPSVKHLCRAHCESCGTARTCTGGRVRYPERPSQDEHDLSKFPLNQTVATRYCSSQVPCRRAF